MPAGAWGSTSTPTGPSVGGVDGGPPGREVHDADAGVVDGVVGQQQGRAAVGEQVALLGRRQRPVHADPDRAQPHRPVERDHHVGVVGERRGRPGHRCPRRGRRSARAARSARRSSSA